MSATNRWITTSRRIYRRLLHLYPASYRDAFGELMLQYFTDQCREVYAHRAGWGVLQLWLRTLLDLGTSMIREHVNATDFVDGLLESPPNRPLPWRGVLLVLIPGLVFFISQIGQLMGANWFFWATRYSAFVFIVPVLAVWGVTRKFPIWGLIPLGTLYSALLGYGYRLLRGKTTYMNQTMLVFLQKNLMVVRTIVILGFLLAIAVLLVANARRKPLGRMVWAWAGVYFLIGLPNFLNAFILRMDTSNPANLVFVEWVRHAPHKAVMTVFRANFYDFYFHAAFLLLILVGGLLSRRHGQLAILLPLGYMFHVAVFGGSGDVNRLNRDWALVFGALLLYRLFLTILAPTWIVRSATLDARRRTSSLGLWGLVVAQAAMFIVRLLVFRQSFEYTFYIYFYEIFVEQLFLLAGTALAINLYLPEEAAVPPVQEDAVSQSWVPANG